MHGLLLGGKVNKCPVARFDWWMRLGATRWATGRATRARDVASKTAKNQ